MISWFYQVFGLASAAPATTLAAALDTLTALFLSRIRAEIFRRVFSLSHKPFYLNQLVTETKFASRSIEEELKKLTTLGLLLTTRDGNRVYYSINEKHPLLPDLRSIVLKTSGLREVVAAALESSADIEFAFVFGSIAHGTDQAESDVDLMIIGSIGTREVAARLRTAAGQIGREINPHIFPRNEFLERLSRHDHFITQVVNNPKLFVTGAENEFGKLVEGRMASPTSDQP